MTSSITGVLYEAKEMSEMPLHGEVIIHINPVKDRKESFENSIIDSTNLDIGIQDLPHPNLRILAVEQSKALQEEYIASTKNTQQFASLTHKDDLQDTSLSNRIDTTKPQILIFQEDVKRGSGYLMAHDIFLKVQKHGKNYFDEWKRLRNNNQNTEDGNTWKHVLERRNNGLPMMDLEETKQELKDTYRLIKVAGPRRLKSFLLGTGIGFLFLGLGLFITIFSPVIWSELIFGLKSRGVIANTSIQILENVSGDIEPQQKAESLGVKPEFSIVIPKIDAKANVIGNVDPLSKKEYIEALKDGVAHAKGTNLPGEGQPIFMFSHSTDSPANYVQYNAVFYLLKKLESGDEIILFRNGREYRYKVHTKTIVDAKDTSWLNPKGSRERLILMTCDPPGTTWKRLMVTALPS